ncbi:MAG: N-acetyl sugar amidotransferase [Alphaproteobacteria bacterium]|nr:N-acetyl sugar amidotransferase [Alphaproteobacteria bacterium]
MTDVQYCVRCLYPETHPLGLVLDEKGVCSGCRIHEEKDELDWAERFARLEKLVAPYRSNSGLRYDCIVPISGGRDSYFVVETVVRRLGLNPLLVSYNRHYNTAISHRNIAYLRTIFDCDYLQQTLSPDTVRALCKRTLDLCGSFHWHTIAGQTVWPVQCAVRFRVPLIIWGAHQGVDQVGMFSHLDEVEMSRWYRKNHDLMGFEPEDIVDKGDGLLERDIAPLFYPDDADLSAVGVRGIYLNNYIRWDTKAQHERTIADYGEETATLARTFDRYNNVDCVHFAGIHDAIKVAKHGYGLARDHACREIRLKRLTREEGLALAEDYESRPVTDEKMLLDWLGMSCSDFWARIDRHRDSRIWRRSEGDWLRIDRQIHPDPDACALHAIGKIAEADFSAHSQRSSDDESYRVFSRGYV